MTNLKSYLIGYLEKENRILKTQMSKNRSALKMSIPEKFEVMINTYNIYSGPTIESALKKIMEASGAIESIFVHAVFANQVRIMVPQKYWMHIMENIWKQNAKNSGKT